MAICLKHCLPLKKVDSSKAEDGKGSLFYMATVGCHFLSAYLRY